MGSVAANVKVTRDHALLLFLRWKLGENCADLAREARISYSGLRQKFNRIGHLVRWDRERNGYGRPIFKWAQCW